MIGSVSYKNTKGKTVIVHLTNHAVTRFKYRHSQLFKKKLNKLQALETLKELFSNAHRKNAESNRHLLKRKKRHFHTTIYFENYPFRFVVSNQSLVTVELVGKFYKHLYQRKLNN